MSGHTPGPWFTYFSERGIWTVQEPRGWIAELTPDRPNQEANARLIAAAPDLLEAAKAMTEPAGEIAYRERWMALKAAIAKAEGR